MLDIKKNELLAPYTTLKIGAAAEFFAVIKDKGALLEAIAWAREHKKSIWVLGGGSNVLISKKVPGLVLKNEIRGIKILEKRPTDVLVEAKSGESWTGFVGFTVRRGYAGLENLNLIYGTVGGAPVQNIGAYGVELKDVFYHLRAIDLANGQERIFSKTDCRFAYRDSIFKHKLKGRYFIYSVTVKLSRQHDFKLTYGTVREKLAAEGITEPTLRQVAKTIADIRQAKLPDPAILPNAGSFFKNPTITQAQFKKIISRYPDVPHFPAEKNMIKIPAGWLIEATGFKGKKIGPVGMHKKQALVLVNHRSASAAQVLGLVKKIRASIKKRFGIDLEREVNII